MSAAPADVSGRDAIEPYARVTVALPGGRIVPGRVLMVTSFPRPKPYLVHTDDGGYHSASVDQLTREQRTLLP